MGRDGTIPRRLRMKFLFVFWLVTDDDVRSR